MMAGDGGFSSWWCLDEAPGRQLPVERTWIVRHLNPLREQRDRSCDVEVRPRATPRSSVGNFNDWGPPDLAGHLELVREPLPLSSGMRGQPVHCINPATGTDSSVKHVKQVVREEKARRERRARGEPETPTVTEEEQEEEENPEASAAPEDALPEAQRDVPEAQASPARKQSLLEQLLQQQVLNESSLRRFLPQQTLCPTTALRDLNSRPPAAERPASAGGHCAGCGGLHVVREEFPENFPRTACTAARSRRKSEPVPKVANVGVKVKLDRLVANRAATRATRAATSQSCLHAACRASAKSGYQIVESVMSSRFSEPSGTEEESMVRHCMWCGHPVPLWRSPETDGTVDCPNCGRRFDLRKAKTTPLGGPW